MPETRRTNKQASAFPRLQDAGLRLDTLIRLRWLAIVGQSLAVLGVHLALGFPLPLWLCLAAIGASVLLNVVLRLHFMSSRRLMAAETLVFMVFDSVQLAVLLFLTGGMLNPFSFLFLVPMVICAANLPMRHTVMLGGLIVLLSGLLTFWHLPLPWFATSVFNAPMLYIIGMWLSLLAAMAFMSIYAARVAHESRQISRALAATELVLAREQHLSQLDGLAAAAAHELGTPLGTIALVVKEMERSLAQPMPAQPLLDDIRLLQQQVQRCRTILARLTSLETDGDAPFDKLTLTHLLDEVAAPHRGFGIDITLDLAGEGAEPIHQRNAALLHSLGNLVENAVDFAEHEVVITARWTSSAVTLDILDDGPGFSADVLEHLGEPYISSRTHSRSEKDAGSSTTGFGMGLGFFIAKTLLQRMGAQLRVHSRPAPQHGAHLHLVWPRAALDTCAPSRQGD